MANDRLTAEMDAIRWALSSIRIPATPGEYDLHAMVADALAAAAITVEHEVPLAPRARIDFVSGNIGIEVKQGKLATKRLRAQVQKYLSSNRIEALILITTRGALLPAVMNSKPVCVIGLNRFWGVSLP